MNVSHRSVNFILLLSIFNNTSYLKFKIPKSYLKRSNRL